MMAFGLIVNSRFFQGRWIFKVLFFKTLQFSNKFLLALRLGFQSTFYNLLLLNLLKLPRFFLQLNFLFKLVRMPLIELIRILLDIFRNRLVMIKHELIVFLNWILRALCHKHLPSSNQSFLTDHYIRNQFIFSEELFLLNESLVFHDFKSE